MKRWITTLMTVMTIVLCGCENKRDHSGALGGMWQLTEWRANDGAILNKEGEPIIYYSIRNNIIMLQKLPGGNNDYYLAYFKQTIDSIIIDTAKIWHYPSSLYHPSTVLKKYGVPMSGRLHIDVLNSDNLAVDSEEGTLLFRKY